MHPHTHDQRKQILSSIAKNNHFEKEFVSEKNKNYSLDLHLTGKIYPHTHDQRKQILSSIAKNNHFEKEFVSEKNKNYSLNLVLLFTTLAFFGLCAVFCFSIGPFYSTKTLFFLYQFFFVLICCYIFIPTKFLKRNINPFLLFKPRNTTFDSSFEEETPLLKNEKPKRQKETLALIAKANLSKQTSPSWKEQVSYFPDLVFPVFSLVSLLILSIVFYSYYSHSKLSEGAKSFLGSLLIFAGVSFFLMFFTYAANRNIYLFNIKKKRVSLSKQYKLYQQSIACGLVFAFFIFSYLLVLLGVLNIPYLFIFFTSFVFTFFLVTQEFEKRNAIRAKKALENTFSEDTVSLKNKMEKRNAFCWLFFLGYFLFYLLVTGISIQNNFIDEKFLFCHVFNLFNLLMLCSNILIKDSVLSKKFDVKEDSTILNKDTELDRDTIKVEEFIRLLNDLENPYPKIRLRALKEIRKKRYKSKRIFLALVKATKDPNAKVRREAKNTLGYD